MPALTRRALLALAALVPLLASCAPDWDPYHLANKFRVLTIKAEPPEVQIDPGLLVGEIPDTFPSPVTLTALVSPPIGQEDLDDVEINYQWSACFASLGAIAQFECIIPELNIPIPGNSPTVQIDFLLLLTELGARLENLPLGELGEMGEMGEMPAAGDDPLGIAETCDSEQGCCEQRLEDTTRRLNGQSPLYNNPCPDFLEPFGCQIQITLEAGPVGEETIRAVRDIRLDFDSVREPNQNPVVNALLVEGAPQRGAEVSLTVDLDESALETYVDGNCNTTTEEPVFSFFTTAGKIDPPAIFGAQRTTTLKLPTNPEIEEVQVYVVARDADARQGTDFATTTIQLTD